MNSLVRIAAAAAICASSGAAWPALTPAGMWSGNVGLSVDGIGSNLSPVGSVQAEIPVTATILQAYLYSAGTPFPFYPDSPHTLADYNGAGITLAGSPITNFSALVGATSTRVDIGGWGTGRADVTSLVQSLRAAAPGVSSFSWLVSEGNLNNRIDGEVLAIVYSDASRPLGSVALLNGGQNTGGETSFVNLGTPLTDPSAPGFAAELGLGISFSISGQSSTVKVNGATAASNAGNNDDGLQASDGSLITVGGLGDPASNNGSYADDHELYNLAPFLATGNTSFSIFTQNPTNDDNIFFASLYLTGDITSVTPSIPEPESYALLLAGLGVVAVVARRRRVR